MASISQEKKLEAPSPNTADVGVPLPSPLLQLLLLLQVHLLHLLGQLSLTSIHRLNKQRWSTKLTSRYRNRYCMWRMRQRKTSETLLTVFAGYPAKTKAENYLWPDNGYPTLQNIFLTKFFFYIHKKLYIRCGVLMFSDSRKLLLVSVEEDQAVWLAGYLVE